MAISVVKAAMIFINGVDLSDHMKDIELTMDIANVDATTMAPSNTQTWQNNQVGIMSWQLSAGLLQDEASGKTGITLWNIFVGGVPVSVEARPYYGPRSATNPGYNGLAMLKTYPILVGGPSDMAQSKVVFLCSGPLARSLS